MLEARFGKQNIHVSKGAKGLEPSAAELAAIEAWKNTRSPEAYAAEPPFLLPVPQCMNSPFGVKRFYDGIFSGNYHKGIDQKAPQGQAVVAIAAGKVSIAHAYPLHGGAVALNHGQGLGSIYIHLSAILVKEGQLVKAGQVIGKVGSTGFAMGPHLHWGLYQYGIPLNPLEGWVRPSVC